MKICIDIQAAIGQQAGVGRYTRYLVEELACNHGEHSLMLFYFDFRNNGFPFNRGTAKERAIRWCPGRFMQRAWRTIGVPPFNWLSGRADLYHFPNFIRPPLTCGKSVVTIHDVSFLRHPETTEQKNLHYLKSQIHKTVQRADAVITDSVFSKNEIEELLHVDSSRVFAVHLGLEQAHGTPTEEGIQATKRRYGLERPYILSVGTLEPRKNYPFLIDLFDRMEGFNGDLVIAGMRGWKYDPVFERVRHARRVDNIHLLEFVADEDLLNLYAGAELFVCPSLYEGFGFTPLEAMTHGIPVLSSAGGSLKEVLGDAAVVIDGFNLDEWTSELTALLYDETRKESLRERGRKHVKQFTWAKTAAETLGVYEAIRGC
jgi:glycosyltransferase involved in cell wall biosynthesis